MLASCFYYSNGHFYGPEVFRYFGKLVLSEPFNIAKSLVNSIFSFLSCCMTGYAMNLTVQYHKAFFAYSQVHFSGFAHDSEIYRTKVRENQFNTVLAGYFFFGCGGEDKVIFEVFLFVEVKESCG